jgi:hypothetical protein
MAASEAWAAQATFARLVNKGVPPEKIQIPNLIALVPSALKRLALGRQDAFATQTTVALASGVADLDPLETALFLPETIDPGQIFHASSIYPLQPLPDEAALTFPWSNFFIYYCLSGHVIKTRNLDGTLDTLAGVLTVTAVQVPAIATLMEDLWADFLDEMEVLAMPG